VLSRSFHTGADWIVAFAATPLDDTLFVGGHRACGVGRVPPGTTDPVGWSTSRGWKRAPRWDLTDGGALPGSTTLLHMIGDQIGARRLSNQM